ncbi:hypothetical protein R82526_00493 [Ralstonia mannitolilytica]|uniref:hypothetical protein n=1 Tax=Pseudomonadota TaxID=1224 RepID=UPI0015DEE6C0|nr:MULTISPECIES: hypothetical protein [Pseudomonadota]MBA0352024.1 hypothetical protein [Stenotrophomonas maltophilia]MDH0549608.1 hypothetical protein [Stenotrophomonas sp. GD04006]CAJ0680005.1 hypothetical protein R82526_00493 [Ralstonia mannitolilytica]CAJ0847787.1 hypothetical protein R76727_00007 [Ralstonia mannitolilytica]
MTRFVSFGSPEHKRMQRDQRIHVMPASPGTVAVHLVFAARGYVVNHGTLTKSMGEARKLAHKLMEQWDAANSSPLQRHATLRPITAQQAGAASNDGAFDAAQFQADYELIVQTCYDAICHCPDADVRMQAAHLLQSVGYIPPRSLQ